MARIVNKEEHAAKRNEILDTAQRLVDTKSYERMTIQDILDDLQISKGAFYHYFDSKPALLEALTQRMVVEFEQALLPVIQDPHLSAIEKLQSLFLTVIRSKATQRTYVAALLRAWYADENAIVRQKVDEAMVNQLGPLLTKVVHQGIQEGSLTTTYPDHVGDVIWSLVRGLQDTPSRLLLAFTKDDEEQPQVESVVAAHTAYMDAIERVLGAPTGSLYRVDAETVMGWVAALSSSTQGGLK